MQTPSSPFAVQAKWYDVIYASKPYEEEANKISTLLKEHHPGARSLLSLGCGTGRYEACLAKIGYQVVGVDCSLEMLEVAKQRMLKQGLLNKVELVHADAREVRLARQFDAVLLLFCMVNYCESNFELEALLANCFAHLKEDGCLMFDTWHGPGVERNPPQLRSSEYQLENSTLLRTVEPSLSEYPGRFQLRYSFSHSGPAQEDQQSWHEEHLIRPFYPREIQICCSKLGLRVVSCLNWQDLSEISENSWTALWTLRRAA